MSRESRDEATGSTTSATRRSVLASLAAAGVGAGVLGSLAAAQESEADVETFALEVSEAGWRGVAPGPIAGQDDPTLDLRAGRTYRIVWRNADGRPHALSILNEDEFEMRVLRVLAVTADDVTVFDDPAANATGNLTWANVSTAAVGYLALQPGPGNATRLAVQDVPVVNETGNETDPGQEVVLVETSPVLMEQGDVQAVEFVADPAMSAYVDPSLPGAAQGAIEVGGAADGNVTDGNVTDGNVTDGNVTGGNVTVGGNATGEGNATDGGNASGG